MTVTVGECLKKWLGEYENADIEELATDFIEGENGSFAIYKAPNNTVIFYNDGSSLITEYYQFFARQPTQIDKERIGNQQFMSDLEKWVEEKDINEEYPDLFVVGNLTCVGISIENSAAVTSQEENNAIYQISIALQYLKER